MNAANDSVRVIGIGRVRDDPKALEINFTGKPSDDDMRRIHDLLRDGPPSNDDALWSMLVKQAHGRLGIGPDPGESAFDYLQRALQRVRPYGVAPTLKTWQHDETGRITEAAECPGPRWAEVPSGVRPVEAQSMVGVGTNRIEQPQTTHGSPDLYGVSACDGGQKNG